MDFKSQFRGPDHGSNASRRRGGGGGRILNIALLSAVAWLLYDKFTTPPAKSLTDQHATIGAGGEKCKLGAGELVASSSFSWSDLDPSEDIHWTDCYGGHLCARLNLPLDYEVPSGPKTAIALRLQPVKDPSRRLGTILLNPGGPGGSGTEFVERRSKELLTVLGSRFDILGFDPRGVGASTPAANCFDSESQRDIWALGDPQLDPSDNSTVTTKLSRAVVNRERCLRALGGNGKDEDPKATAEDWGIGRFMGSASVATDMLKISEKLGQEKLLYWGFSYGTMLGQYFAAMYGDKIGRMVIDGVGDGEGYRDTEMKDALVNTDDAVKSFFGFCHKGGPTKCSFYKPTVAAIEERFTAILDSLSNEPVPVPFAESGPILITNRAMLEYIFTATYAPIQRFPELSNFLIAIETQNQTALQEIAPYLRDTAKCKCEKENLPRPMLRVTDAYLAITCGDAAPSSEEFDLEGFRKFAQEQDRISHYAGFQMNDKLQCFQWRLTEKRRYAGPLVADNTSYPLLLVSTRFDPVCPLVSAKTVQKRYKGSGLLIQNSYGHCSVSAPSLCTAKAIRAYFVNGTLPADGTVCEADELPFVGTVTPEDTERTLSEEDAELLRALRELSSEPFGWRRPY